MIKQRRKSNFRQYDGRLRDYRLPVGSVLKEPCVRSNPGESYTAAYIRYRKRRAAYRDALVMAECFAIADRGPVARQFFKAFYGITALEAARVLVEQS